MATRKSPGDAEMVRRTLRGIRRKHGRPPDRKAALLLDSLEKMMDLEPNNLRGLRNRAIMSLTWGACRRIGEVYNLDVREAPESQGWIEFDDQGLVVVLRRSKTNQDKRYLERYGVPAGKLAPCYCPVRLVKDWIERSGRREGPLFVSLLKHDIIRGNRMQHHALCKMIKIAAQRIRLDPQTVAPHSLRAGYITWLYLEGIHPQRIMEQSGHKDVEALLLYIRPLRSVATSPLSDTRWAR